MATAGCAATGLPQAFVFSQPSLVKYAATVAAPTCLFLLVGMRRPVLVLTCVATAVAPFSFVATFQGIGLLLVTPVLGLAAAIAVGDAMLHGRLPRRPQSAIAVATVAGLVLLSAPLALSDQKSHYAALLLAMVAIGWLVARQARTPIGRRALVAAFLAGAVIQAGIAIYEFVSGHQLNLYGAVGSSSYSADYFFNFDSLNRAAAGLPDPISLGNVLALACPVAVAAAASAATSSYRLLAAIAGVVCALGLVATFSRMSWVGAVVGVVVVVVFLPARRSYTTGLAVAVLGVVVVFGAFAIGGPAVSQRFDSIQDPTAAGVATAQGDDERVALWHAAEHIFRQHPVAGVGLGNDSPLLAQDVAGVSGALHAHSTYLNTLADAGTLGGIALGGLLLAAFADITRRRGRTRDQAWVAMSAGCIGTLLVVWSTDVTIRYVSVAVMVAWVFGITAGLRSPDDAQSAMP